MKSSRKPPLARSPMRIQPRLSLRSSNAPTPLRTPSRRLSIAEKPNPATDVNGKENRPNYTAISSELNALAKMVQTEFGTTNNSAGSIGAGLGNVMNNTENKNTMFERGRYYEEYSARRNERLKRKKSCDEMWLTAEPKTAYKLGIKVESVMKRESKKLESSTVKAVSAAYYSVDRSEHPRYALRSIKKPPLPVPMNIDRSGGGGGGQRKARVPRAPRN